MQTRFWLASAATVALAATGALVAGTISLHGQAPQATAPQRSGPPPESDALLDHDALAREIREAVQTAQDAVKDIDVEVLVADAMQGVPDLALLGGQPRLGVQTRDVTADEAKAAGLSGITGARVLEAPAGSAAGKAGLQSGDIIVTVDGETIRSARQLARVVAESPEGRPLTLGYVRGTSTQTVTVTPEMRTARALPRPEPRTFSFRSGPDIRWRGGRGRLGILVQPLTDQLASFFGAKAGVLVTQVTPASAAATAGITAGDVITEVSGKPVDDTSDILQHLQCLDDGAVVPVTVVRDKKARTVSVTLTPPAATSGSRPAARVLRFTA